MVKLVVQVTESSSEESVGSVKDRRKHKRQPYP